MKLPIIIALIVIALVYAGTYIAEWQLERNVPAPKDPRFEQTVETAKRIAIDRAMVFNMTLNPEVE